MPRLEPARADVIVAGALELAAVMEIFGFDDLIHSESDILDGIAADLRRSLRPRRGTELFSAAGSA